MKRWYFSAEASPVRGDRRPSRVIVTVVGFSASHCVRSVAARSAGGSSFRSRRVRSSAIRCWFSRSASVRVA
jgi:hypothetical protein